MHFREFWPRYLHAHSRPATRAVHYAATLLGCLSSGAALITREPPFLFGIPVAYALAIGAHGLFERNQSLVRVNPVWGAIADLRMFWLAVTGGLGRELSKHGVTAPESRATVARGAMR
jgi:hypothetical protein